MLKSPLSKSETDLEHFILWDVIYLLELISHALIDHFIVWDVIYLFKLISPALIGAHKDCKPVGECGTCPTDSPGFYLS